MQNAIIMIDNEKDEFSDFLNLTFAKVYDMYTKIYFNNYEDLNITNKELENSILVLPSSLNEKKRELIITSLNFDKKNVYIYDINKLSYIYTSKVDNIDGVISNYLDYYWIDKIQIPIAIHCNLKCNRCYHFSNLQAEEKFYDLEQYKKDINNINKLGFKIFEFRFLGGEPLLCDDILDYIKYTKQIYPYSNMKIITNGILLLSKPEEFLKELSRLNISISISLYPPMMKRINEVESRLMKNGVSYEIFRLGDRFNKILNENESIDFEDVAKECEKCIIIYNGVISRCAPSIFINIFNNKFQYNYPETNKEITSFKSRKLVLKYIDRPVELCKYCSGDSNPVSFKWESTPKEISPNDYIR